MGIFNKLRNELIDIIEWIDDSQHTLVWRFPRYQNEIKNGAQLIVRPGQTAVFVREGEIADIFAPGTHELDTHNLPLFSTLAGWKHGFNSPFKAEVYFISTRQLTDLKWGTPNPIMLRDADFGPVRLRAFGNYTLRCIDPAALLRELVGTDHIFEAEEVSQLLRSIIASAFADVLGESKLAALDLAAKYNELGGVLRGAVNERIDDEYGLEVPELTIVNIALPESVERAIDTRSEMGVLGDMNRYQQFQMANAIGAAATNPTGSAASEGMGMGMGLAMAQQMANALQQRPGTTAAPVAVPPAAPPAAPAWHVAVNGQTLGPYSLEQVAQAIQQGQVTPATSVWSAGMPGWLPASQAPQLKGLFAPPPPPPPPPPAG